MAGAPTRYHALSPSDDQARHPHVCEASVTEDDPRPTMGCISVEARTRWTYFLLGCAILLPWNALINGTSFFLSQLTESPFHSTFVSYLSTVYTLTNLICQLYSTVTSKQSSPSRRTFASIIGMIILVTSLCLSTFVRVTPSEFFSFTLFSAASAAVTSSYLCTAVYAEAALLDSSSLQTVISGQAAVAVAVSAVLVTSSMLSLWGSSPKLDSGDEEIAARIFFSVSAIFLGITMIAYIWLTRQSFYKSVIGALERRREVGNTDEFTGLVTDNYRAPVVEGNSRVYQVLRRNLIFLFSIAYVFGVTLAVFPATTVRVHSVHPGTRPSLFIAVHFLVFNFGDLAGRYSCSFSRLLVRSANKILIMALLRTLFVPLILFCNIPRPVTTNPVRPTINSDTLFMITMLALGYTNGFVSTLAILAVPSLEHNPRLKGRREDVDTAATLGGFFVIVGLASGALCSFGVQAMI